MPVLHLDPIACGSCDRADEISGETISLCMQCGTCTGSCPNILEMDVSPSRLMHLAQLGQLDPVLESSAIWTCSACLNCSARCPRGIDLARVMESFRSLRLRRRLGRLAPAEVATEAGCPGAPTVLLVAAQRKLTG